MPSEMLALAGSLVVLASAAIQLVSAVGMLRLPDFYVRLHAATLSSMGGSLLAVAVGSVLVIVGSLGLTEEALVNAIRCWLIAIALFVTASTGSHVLARASYVSGEVSPRRLVVDELRERLEEGE
ncbi:MAG: monovalent cation/H(+) antiporter subunit G [Acidilobaceae archaeon]